MGEKAREGVEKGAAVGAGVGRVTALPDKPEAPPVPSGGMRAARRR